LTAVAQSRARIGLPSLIALTVAIVGWSMIAWLAISGFNTQPRTVAFDLELVLQAGRNVATGASPYDASIGAGTAPEAVGLFFSYPPVVAQAFASFASVPSGVMFAAWSGIAVGGLFVVGRRITARLGATYRDLGTAAVAAGAVTFPFVIAVLFGNVDALFPALYGLALIAAVSPRPSDRWLGGVAVALASVAKLYPLGLGLWFVIRAFRDRGGAPSGRLTTVIALLVAGAAVLFASLVVGGIGPWQEYVRVLGVAGRAELVDARNIGPAAQVALGLGGSSEVARLLQIPVLASSVVVTVWAAWTRHDPVESLAIAAACTLFILPVTWVHYPAALLPFGLAAAARSQATAGAYRVGRYLAVSIAISVVALVWLPLLWVAFGSVLWAVHISATSRGGDTATR
jgi:hypothetical protein